MAITWIDRYESLDEAAQIVGARSDRRGVVIDHLHLVSHLVELFVIGGHDWVRPIKGGRAYPVVCGELVAQIGAEFPGMTARCGARVAHGANGCAAHHIPEEGTCEHGLSAALCAGPGHYPNM